MTEPRIYVACLASYNAGTLHGAWVDVDATTDAEDLDKTIADMLSRSPVVGAEEFAIHDHEGFPSGTIGEFSNTTELAALGAFLAEHGSAGAVALSLSDDLDSAQSMMRDGYRGEWESFKAYVEESFDETTEIPPHLASYIDYDAVARDWENEHSHERDDDGMVHVFSNC